ncbi:unnamed protein product, partial [Auanema sp. JU1783]
MLSLRLIRSFSTTIRYSSSASSSSNLKEANASTLNTPLIKGYEKPETYHIDGKSFETDDLWNLSPAVQKLMARRLLEESSNPLSLLKQRLINYFHQTYRKPGNRSPLFTICDKEPRVVTTYENFDSLLTPLDHVSRRPSDTYYVNSTNCLRAHTSAHQHS